MTTSSPTGSVLPLYFGNPEAPLFGQLHGAQPPASAAFGLVVCNSFGFESLHAHRSMVELAKSAAAAGIPTLRFDYQGCGNSSGDEYTPDLLTQWVRSVHSALDELKRRTGLQRVCLVGLRLGALLATMAALERSDIAGLVAIAPVLQGRQFVREMRALSATGSMETVTGSNGESLVEAGGFFLTEGTAQALSAVDLRSPKHTPAPRILIVQRDDMPASSRWADTLVELGAVVHNGQWPGYKAMMEDPQRTQVPQEMFAHILQDLLDWSAQDQVAPTPLAQPSSLGVQAPSDLSYVAADFQETVVRIEAGGTQIFGILTSPKDPGGAAVAAKPRNCILMVNQGCVHHIGPSRLWVTQARKWAREGKVSLRMDLTGIGESAPRPGLAANVPYSPAALEDIDVALHFLQGQARGGNCHMLSMCSGAYHAFQVAVAGKPLRSAIIVNPLIFFVSEAQALNAPPEQAQPVRIQDHELTAIADAYKRKIFSLEPWKKLLSGRVDYRYLSAYALKRGTQAASSAAAKVAGKLGLQLRTPLARELGQAANSGTLLRFVFAEGDEGYKVLQRQADKLMEKLQAQKKMSLDFVGPADHTFTTFSAREKLMKILDQRISQIG